MDGAENAHAPIQAKKGGSFAAALSALCPACGKGSLFTQPLHKGGIRFVDSCSSCGLQPSRFNVGDGPAAFLTLLVGALVVVLALWLEFSLTPPWWLHVIVWLPFTVLGTLAGLRIAKAALLQTEYHRMHSPAAKGENASSTDHQGSSE